MLKNIVMDTIHLFQFSIYSKIIQEFTNEKGWLENPIVIFIGVFFFLYKMIPHSWIFIFQTEFMKYFHFNFHSNESSIFLPYHTKIYATYAGKTVQKTHYSERFLAINHYLQSKNEIAHLIEVMNFENSKDVYHQDSEFILIPNNYEKICICHTENIWFEVILENNADNLQKDDDKTPVQVLPKKYIYRLSIPRINSIQVLHKFVEKCIQKYKMANEHGEPTIYEYTKYRIDDETDRISMTFRNSPFFTNKTFENLFFEGKSGIRQEIAEFSTNLTCEEKAKVLAKYRHLGIPYKKIFLLHGPPGCGKTSLIKSMSVETGRHIMYVPWSRMKTCAEFSNIFYEIKVETKVLQQKDVIYVFEDFDANHNDAIKSRNIENLHNQNQQILYDKTDIEKKKKDIEDPILKLALENIMTPMKWGPVDELTLECVLNTLDGIKELYDAILIFTTNDISAIDPAVIRPGRIDRIIEMKLASKSVIQEILGHFYKDIESDIITPSDALQLLCSIPDNIAISPAKVQEICLQYRDSMEDAIQEIIRVFADSSP